MSGRSGIGDSFGSHSPVAADLSSVDWAATPLGPPEHWPRSLSTVVRALIDTRFSMWMAWGPDLTFFCNDAYRRDTLRAKYPWALGRPAREVWAEIWDDIAPRIERVLRTGDATWDEALLLFLERSGYVEETYHTFSYSPLTGDDGAVAGMLCVVTEDTDRVIAERRMGALRGLAAELARAGTEAEVLAATGRQFEREPRSLPFALVYLFDQDEPACRLAVSGGAGIGDPVAPARLRLDDPDCPWPIESVIRGHTVVVEDLGHRFPTLPTGAWDQPPQQALAVPLQQPGQRRPYGALIVGLNRYRPLDNDYRGFVDLVAGQIVAGLTRARAYDAERERAAQLAELDRAKTTFFTNISHELRTPLTLLLGPTEDALADELATPATQRVRLELVHRNAQRLLKLVNSLLDFSRLESGRMQARFEPLDLSRYTAQLAGMFESAVHRAGLNLTIDCPPLSGPVYVDREMWAKIVLNLLSNALKATYVGGISVGLHEQDGRVELTVADSGIGITPAEQQRLFERFHRVSGAALRTHEGSGIGLALVAELAALHGGAVSVRSTPGVGSTFAVTVPQGRGHLPSDQVSAEPVADAPGAAQFGALYLAEAARWVDGGSFDDAGTPLGPGRPAPSAPPGDAPRVLVADDTPDMREYVAGLLAPTYQVQTAPDGERALELARDDPPDLVLTDVMMPRLDGFGLLAALRADPATLHIPVIMLSARAGDEATVEGLEAGADDYLVKPFAARELLARVRANLELDRVRRVADELARSRELLDQAERLARVGSWELDLRTNEIRASDEYFRVLGVAREDIAARGLSAAFDHVHPDDLPRAEAVVAAALAGTTDLEAELRVIPDGGAERIVRAYAVLQTNPDGSPGSLRGSVQDVTDQRRAEVEMTAAAAERQAAAREHRIAEELQRSLLPRISVQHDRMEVAAYYRAGVAGTQVGGDWYDAVPTGEGRVALVIGDVMGRGVRAASVMGQLRATARAYARVGLPPGEVLGLLDRAVGDLEDQMIVTCVYAVYDPADNVLTYANAGHLPALVVGPDGAVTRLGAGGPPLGTGLGAVPQRRIVLPVGCLVTLYTDGLIERRGDDLEQRIDTLGDLLAGEDLASLALTDVPAAVVGSLAPDVADDDIAVLVARIFAEPRVQFTVPAEPGSISAARRQAETALTRWALDGVVDDALLVVSELVTNALRHGSAPDDAGGDVGLRLIRTPDALRIEVSDGSPTAPVPQHARDEDDHGRGLQIVDALARQWGSRPVPGGKIVWCDLALE